MSGHSTTDNELMVVNPRHLLLSMAFAVIILLVLLPYPAAMLFVAGLLATGVVICATSKRSTSTPLV
jgi:ABC-type transport system involved in cytochrome bd biosynthesis fused ATPase/permease subunit